MCTDCGCGDCINNICPLAFLKPKMIKMVLPDCLKSAVRGFIQGNIIPGRQMVSRLQLPLLMSGLPLAPRSTCVPRGNPSDSPGFHLELTPAEGKVMFGCRTWASSWPPPARAVPTPHSSPSSALNFGTCPKPIAKLLLCSCSGRADCWGSMDPDHQRISNRTGNHSRVVEKKNIHS